MRGEPVRAALVHMGISLPYPRKICLFLANRFASFLKLDRIFIIVQLHLHLPLVILPASTSTIRSAIEDHS